MIYLQQTKSYKANNTYYVGITDSIPHNNLFPYFSSPITIFLFPIELTSRGTYDEISPF